MNIYLYTLTGNGRKFLTEAGIDMETIKVLKSKTVAEEDFVLVTNTIGFGEIPKPVERFLEKNHELCKGIVAGGNRNWGQNFAVAGDLITERYPDIPLLMKIELNGTKKQREQFKKIMEEFDGFTDN